MTFFSADEPKSDALNQDAVPLTLEEKNALTQCYVICRGYSVIGMNGALARYVRCAYPQVGFELLAEAFRDAVKGDLGSSAVKIDQLTNRMKNGKQDLRKLTEKIRPFK